MTIIQQVRLKTTCLICKCLHPASEVAISYSVPRAGLWKNKRKMQTTAMARLCSEPRQEGCTDKTCKYGVEIQIQMKGGKT